MEARRSQQLEGGISEAGPPWTPLHRVLIELFASGHCLTALTGTKLSFTESEIAERRTKQGSGKV